MILSVTGPHRTGKTSLARAFAEKHDWFFLETSASAIFAELGLDPAANLAFEDRLRVQELILERFIELYRSALSMKKSVITDRCPLDLQAYTMAGAMGDAVPEHLQERFANYMKACTKAMHDYFSGVVLVQPGIPLVSEPGKAFMSVAFIESLNSIFMGLLADPRLTIPAFHIGRSRTSMDERIKILGVVNEKITSRAAQELTDHYAEGRLLN